MRSPHLRYLQKCLSLAEQAPSLPTNFRVGALLVSRKDGDLMTEHDELLSTGYTMELPGNTHAEQCLLSNYASKHLVPEERVSEVLPDMPGRKLVLYVTMEPCGKRLSGNLPCVQRIIQTRKNGRRGIEKVYFGVKEPTTFVGESEGCKMLTEAGIEWRVVQGLEREILTVATAGHQDSEKEVKEALSKVETNFDDISEDEAKRQDLLRRNPMKRVMEGTVSR
ncbi:cytidine deaminase-like protein [Aspergillus spinulosporus]